jgi:hypothetical protein
MKASATAWKVSMEGLTSVGNEDLGVLDLMRAVDTNLLVEDESLVEVRVSELASLLLDDLNVFQVGRSLRPLSSDLARPLLQTQLTFSRRTAETASSAK